MDAKTITFEVNGSVAVITLDRPDLRNAQNLQMLLEIDEAYRSAEADDEIRVIVMKANGKHFSAGHDMSPAEFERFERETRKGKAGIEPQYDWERRNYLELTQRWRDLPKPTIAAVQGKCIAGGLMLIWPCDIIIASDDAEFCDPVVRMGIGGVEYHAHAWEMGHRKAKEMLFTGGFFSASEAERMGMVNHVVPREALESRAMELAEKIAKMNPFGLRMAKQAVNRTLDMMGQRNAIAAIFDMHHLAHAQSTIVNQGNVVGGMSIKDMKGAN